MKGSLLLKLGFLIPLLLFIDYVIMIAIGCVTCLLGFGDDFYCGPYCIIAKIVLGATVILFLFLIFTDIKESLKKILNATPQKEEKSL